MRIALVLFLLFSVVSNAQEKYAEVTRNAPIRQDSLSSSSVIERVKAGVDLPLLEDRIFGTGYLKVRTPKDKVGYIYKSRVRIKTVTSSENSNTTTQNGNLELHMINIGQGDAMIIRCPDGKHELLIDAAELNAGFRYAGSQTEFRNYMTDFQSKDNPIEVVVATHPHSDHIAGMSWIINNYAIGKYVDNGMPNTSGTYKSLENELTEHNINRLRLTDSLVPQIDFCPRTDVNARILRPEGFDEPGIDPNNYSVIVRVDYGSSSFLFTGDAEVEMEDKLIEDQNTVGLLDVDFLKVGHHGSHSSSKKAFLDVVTPDIAAISCGAETVGTNAKHKHPRMVTVNTLIPYLKNRNGMETTLEAYDKPNRKWDQVSTKAALYITNNDGDLIFLSDGNKIWRKGDQ